MIKRYCLLMLFAVISLGLVAASCSSTTKVVKKNKEELAVKESVLVDVNNTTSTKEEIIKERKKDSLIVQDSTIRETVIKYVPVYDTNNNLIPFQFEEDYNGKKYKVNISGAGTVESKTYTKTKETKAVVVDTDKYEKYYNEQIVLNERLKKELNSYKNTVSKDKETKADYIKYIIILIATIVLLTAIFTLSYSYIKRKLKMIIP